MPINTPFLKAPGNYDTDAESLKTGLTMTRLNPETGELVPDKGYTQQQFAEETDINTIVRRFGLTGELPSDLKLPKSGDFTSVTDFQTAMQAVVQAEEQFMLLPAAMRARFHNDPQELLSFLEDSNNKDEAIKLGLVDKPAVPERTVLQAVDELAKQLTPPAAKA